jgi:hypothetical protein
MGGRIDSMEFARSCAYKVTRFIEKDSTQGRCQRRCHIPGHEA